MTLTLQHARTELDARLALVKTNIGRMRILETDRRLRDLERKPPATAVLEAGAAAGLLVDIYSTAAWEEAATAPDGRAA